MSQMSVETDQAIDQRPKVELVYNMGE